MLMEAVAGCLIPFMIIPFIIIPFIYLLIPLQLIGPKLIGFSANVRTDAKRMFVRRHWLDDHATFVLDNPGLEVLFNDDLWQIMW
jgi:hypothetical protein